MSDQSPVRETKEQRPRWKWERVAEQGKVTEWTLLAGDKVLCRFWHEDMPPEALLIAAVPKLLAALQCEHAYRDDSVTRNEYLNLLTKYGWVYGDCSKTFREKLIAEALAATKELEPNA